jgi:hypothetical protein
LNPADLMIVCAHGKCRCAVAGTKLSRVVPVLGNQRDNKAQLFLPLKHSRKPMMPETCFGLRKPTIAPVKALPPIAQAPIPRRVMWRSLFPKLVRFHLRSPGVRSLTPPGKTIKYLKSIAHEPGIGPREFPNEHKQKHYAPRDSKSRTRKLATCPFAGAMNLLSSRGCCRISERDQGCRAVGAGRGCSREISRVRRKRKQLILFKINSAGRLAFKLSRRNQSMERHPISF